MSLYLGLRFSKKWGRKLDLVDGTNVYYTSIEGLAFKLATTFNQVAIVDEAYFGGVNLESNKSRVIDLNTKLNAVRNRGHIIIFNYSKINRATKMLLEIANYWFHKPSPEMAVLRVRDREFVGDDAWGIDPLLKARNKGAKRWYLMHNEGFIHAFKIPWVSEKIFQVYEENKTKSQVELAEVQRSIQQARATEEKIMNKIKDDYKDKKFGIDRIKEYLEINMNFSRPLITKYTVKFRDWLLEESATERSEVSEAMD